MKLFTKIIVLFFIGMSMSFTSNAQGSYHKSNLSISAGLAIGLNANINYEYRITDNSFISAGYGKLASMSVIPHLDLTHVFLKGYGNHFFEFGYGVIFVNPIDLVAVFPNVRLGYRKLNDYNSAFFRTGISVSEGIYLGFGRSF